MTRPRRQPRRTLQSRACDLLHINLTRVPTSIQANTELGVESLDRFDALMQQLIPMGQDEGFPGDAGILLEGVEQVGEDHRFARPNGQGYGLPLDPKIPLAQGFADTLALVRPEKLRHILFFFIFF